VANGPFLKAVIPVNITSSARQNCYHCQHYRFSAAKTDIPFNITGSARQKLISLSTLPVQRGKWASVSPGRKSLKEGTLGLLLLLLLPLFLLLLLMKMVEVVVVVMVVVMEVVLLLVVGGRREESVEL
jgi:hypothetical protein